MRSIQKLCTELNKFGPVGLLFIIKINILCFVLHILLRTLACLKMIMFIKRQKGRDLTRSYDKRPYTHRKIQKVMFSPEEGTPVY